MRLSFLEVLRTITIPAVHPFVCTFDTRSHQRTRAVKGLLDMSDEDGWEGARDVTLVLRMDAVGPWDVEVLSIDVACDVGLSRSSGAMLIALVRRSDEGCGLCSRRSSRALRFRLVRSLLA